MKIKKKKSFVFILPKLASKALDNFSDELTR